MLALFDNLHAFGNPDIRTKNLVYFNSLVPVTIVLTVYIYFTQSWGMQYMKRKRRIIFRKVLIVYDLLQIFGCSYITIMACLYLLNTNWICGEIIVNNSKLEEPNILIFYHLLKVMDLFESVFHVLSKRDDHLTCAHYYHHIMMVILTWLIVRYAPGGHSLFLPVINSVINIIKYSSYLTTAYYKNRERCMFWRNNVPSIQLIQFLVTLVVFVLPFLKTGCGFPKQMLVLGILQVAILIGLTIYYYIMYYNEKNEQLEY